MKNWKLTEISKPSQLRTLRLSAHVKTDKVCFLMGIVRDFYFNLDSDGRYKISA